MLSKSNNEIVDLNYRIKIRDLENQIQILNMLLSKVKMEYELFIKKCK